ncbi:MAG: hypothetical protein S4CHLAM7_00840 [Chlamydiae bacterium]|nr:hypothetical protein [Chlamydiota bacterium]
MAVFGSTLARGEQHLRYVAGLEGGLSPVTSDIQMELNNVRSRPLSRLVGSIWDGVTSTITFGALGSAAYPFISTNLRASIMGATRGKICGVCKENATKLTELTKWISGNYGNFVASSCDFIDSFGIPCKVSKDGFASWIGKKVSGLVSLVTTHLDATAQASKCSSNAKESLLLCRLTNYAGSVVKTAETLINHEYATYAFAASAAGLTLWSLVSDLDLPAKSEQKAIELLSEKYDQILEALQNKKEEAKTDYLAKIDLKDVAEGLIHNESIMSGQMKDLNLPSLTQGIANKMIQPIVNLAREVLSTETTAKRGVAHSRD